MFQGFEGSSIQVHKHLGQNVLSGITIGCDIYESDESDCMIILTKLQMDMVKYLSWILSL